MYIYDRPLTASRGLSSENGALHGLQGGKRPGVSSPASQPAEVVRLTEEMTKLAQRNAWTGVERAYKMLESMGDEAFNLIPKDLTSAAAIHQLGAQASWIFGETQLSQTRLLRAKKSLDTTNGPIDDQALRRIIDSLDAIEKAYGAVTIAPRTGPTSKKELKRLQGRGPELLPVVQPFAPDQRRSIEAAAREIKETGSFIGLLPAGNYTLADQSFTINVGTELTGKKRINVLWGN
ncbi:MAG TPA: hypothetical protein VK901_07270 [Nitrospiraceae bacterium]|nr:hypothetical protein [Nitrospiraceae bacterium]